MIKIKTKHIIVVTILSIIFVLLVSSFVLVANYSSIDYVYNELFEGSFAGETVVKKIITENKIIYKTFSTYHKNLQFTKSISELFLQKGSMLPIKFSDEAYGFNKDSRSIFINQKDKYTDVLYYDHPVCFQTKDFETGEKTYIFDPYNIATYMGLIPKFNLWTKGAQYFEIMIPFDYPSVPLRQKLCIRSVGSEFVPYHGKKVEAELLLFTSPGLPEILVKVSKNRSLILAIHISDYNTDFKLKQSLRLFDRVTQKELTYKFANQDSQSKISETVFMHLDGSLFSGKYFLPEGEGPFPAVVLIPDDGIQTRYKNDLYHSIALSLSKNRIASVIVEPYGTSRNQDSQISYNDQKKVKEVLASVNFLKNTKNIDQNNINLLGYKNGGYFAALAASENVGVRSFIVLGLPVVSSHTFDDIKESMINNIVDAGYGVFSQDFISQASNVKYSHINKTLNSQEKTLLIMGRKVPVQAFKDYVTRRPYQTIINSKIPGLVIFSKNDLEYTLKLHASLENADVPGLKTFVFRKLNKFFGSYGHNPDTGWRFVMNHEVINVLNKWINKK
ncbi:MAG: hypothetical protein HQL29_03845 [Candidatus Omnitrophica bacterium]|nr:hypothetical protein [Candidatus Omnitrophota bacterium]